MKRRSRAPAGLCLAALLPLSLAVGCSSDDGGESDKAADAGSSADAAADQDGIAGDAGAGDAGTADVGTADVGTADAGAHDSGPTDAGAADSGPTDAGTSPKYTTCAAAMDCVSKACSIGGADCAKTCLDASTPVAKAKAEAFYSCFEDKCVNGACKDSKDPDCAGECMGTACTDVFLGCVDSEAEGDKPCGAGFGCFDACDSSKGDNFTCMGKCIDAMTAADVELLKAVGACIAKNPGQKIEQACGKELFTCQLGAKHGTQGCHTLFKCGEDCEAAGGKDDACMFECGSKLTEKAKAQFMDLIPCLGKQPGDSADCQAKFKACISPTGNKTCKETFECAGKCPQGNDSPTCMFGCLHETDSAGYDAFQGIQACNTPQGATPTDPPGGATPTEGPSKLCIDSVVTCAEPSGTGGCAALLACSDACGKNNGGKNDGFGCVFECADKANKQAYTDLFTYSTCINACKKQCAGKDSACGTTCTQSKCPAEIKACQGKP